MGAAADQAALKQTYQILGRLAGTPYLIYSEYVDRHKQKVGVT